MKELRETHLQGIISIEQDLTVGIIQGDFGIQIAKDGRVWICVNGQALIRFKPIKKKED
jgi:hypothetical protein